MNDVFSFDSFGLSENLLQAIQELGFQSPSPIQQQVIPHILARRDLIGQAQTGTGKTGAFGLPALHILLQHPGMQLLVMTPTRELAAQVSEELFRFGRYAGIKTATISGGHAFKGQIEALRKGVQVIVATPGRLLDLLSSGSVPNFSPGIVVLDEADEMLDMGFLEDIKHIFRLLPTQRQTLLFSATMPLPIQQLGEQILQHPLTIKAAQKETVNQDIEQFYYVIREEERDDAIIRLIDAQGPEKGVIFCRTKKDVDRLTHLLVQVGYLARGLHGDMEQPQREEVIRSFRTQEVRFLVATDVAARGLNVPNVSHVFNYHLPFDPNSYVHRIGRTGRAGNKGIASTLLTLRERYEMQRFEKALKTKIQAKSIPSLGDVKKVKRQQLAQQILAQPIHDEAEAVLAHLSTSPSLALQLVSCLLSREKIRGPEQIGCQHRLSEPMHERQKGSGIKKEMRHRAGPQFSRNRRKGDEHRSKR